MQHQEWDLQRCFSAFWNVLFCHMGDVYGARKPIAWCLTSDMHWTPSLPKASVMHRDVSKNLRTTVGSEVVIHKNGAQGQNRNLRKVSKTRTIISVVLISLDRWMSWSLPLSWFSVGWRVSHFNLIHAHAIRWRLFFWTKWTHVVRWWFYLVN